MALAGCAVVATAAVVWPAMPGNAMVDSGRSDTYDPDRITFTATGQAVRDLYPGSGRRMPITIANPYGFPIRVEELNARLASSSNRHCPAIAAHLVVHERHGPRLPLRISSHDQRSAGSVLLSMPATVGDNCQGTTFTIRFSGTASKVRR